jgi:predicted Zn-dependent protease
LLLYCCLVCVCVSCRHALELSRLEQYDEARQAFQQLLSNDPTFCRGWVSFAQMERRAARTQDPQRYAAASASSAAATHHTAHVCLTPEPQAAAIAGNFTVSRQAAAVVAAQHDEQKSQNCSCCPAA